MSMYRRQRPIMARRDDRQRAELVRQVRRRRGLDGGGGPSGGRSGLGVLVLVGLALAFVVFVLPPLFGDFARAMAEDNPDLIRLPFIGDAVRESIGDRVDQPAGTDETPVTFTIESGASARQITEQLVQRGLVADRLAFSYILINEGVGSRLRAGTYTLDRTMSPREIAEALQRAPNPPVQRVTVSFRFGLRLEQVTAQLVEERARLGIDARQFYELAANPPAELRADYSMLETLPAGRSLEGYLGLGVFEIERGTDAEGLLRTLLERREAEVGDLVDHDIPEPLTTFYEALTLASIVESEAAVDEERPLIAGVFVNRLDRNQWPTRLLNADPTVIYGKDSADLRDLPIEEWNQFVFWAPPGSAMAEVQLPDDLFGYQTYRSRGLPPGPIRSPTVASVVAALEPDTDDGYLYFVAKADGTNTHAFARTWEEHLANIERYVRGGGAPEPTAEPTP